MIQLIREQASSTEATLILLLKVIYCLHISVILFKSTCMGGWHILRETKSKYKQKGGTVQWGYKPCSSCSLPQGKCCHQALHSQDHFDPPRWEFGEYSTGHLLGHSIPRALHQGGRNLGNIAKWNYRRINSHGPNLKLELLWKKWSRAKKQIIVSWRHTCINLLVKLREMSERPKTNN